MLSDVVIEEYFPNLRPTGYHLTSPETITYNCIAWVMGADDQWWEPVEAVGYYWPPHVPQNTKIASAVKLFENAGFEVCETDEFEEGFEKIALYGQEGEYTHAARQTVDGKWSSKLGGLHDIEHESLEGLTGIEYGIVVQIFRRSY